jgi:hypothetical protein
MAETVRHVYHLLFRFLKLVGVLPIATNTTHRCSSTMKLVKTILYNRLYDDNLSVHVSCYMEKEEMSKVTNDQVVKYLMYLKNQIY